MSLTGKQMMNSLEFKWEMSNYLASMLKRDLKVEHSQRKVILNHSSKDEACACRNMAYNVADQSQKTKND